MKILAVETCPTRFAGGQERSLFEVLGRLHKEAGFEIHLAYHEEGDLLEEYEKFCHHCFKQTQRVVRVRKLGSFVTELFQMVRYVKRYGIERIYINQYFDSPFWGLVSRISNVPLIVHLRIPAPHYLSNQYRFGLKSMRVGIAISNHTKQSYVAHGLDEKKIRVLYNAIDTSIIKAPNINGIRERVQVVYAGRISREKGLDVLLEAINLLNSTRKIIYDVTIFGRLRGSDVPENYLQMLDEKHDKSNGANLEFHDHQADISDAIDSADLLVLPSLVEEGFGRIILEAFVRGKAVIASESGGIPEVYGEVFPFFGFERGNAKSLADRIVQVLNDVSELESDILKMQERIRKQFSYDGYSDRWINAAKID